jgi:hypothetical protein
VAGRHAGGARQPDDRAGDGRPRVAAQSHEEHDQAEHADRRAAGEHLPGQPLRALALMVERVQDVGRDEGAARDHQGIEAAPAHATSLRARVGRFLKLQREWLREAKKALEERERD